MARRLLVEEIRLLEARIAQLGELAACISTLLACAMLLSIPGNLFMAVDGLFFLTSAA